MHTAELVDQYAALVAIRRSAARRNAIIMALCLGASFLIGIVLDAALPSNERAAWLGIALSIVLALAFAAMWSRYEALDAVIGLAEELKHIAHAQGRASYSGQSEGADA